MNTMTAGRFNVYYCSVNSSITLWLRFTAITESAFSSKPEAALPPFLMHFEQHVGLHNQKYYTPMGGRKMDVVPFYRNWRENETTWQLKPKRTAAASRGFLAAAHLSCLCRSCKLMSSIICD